MDIQTLKNKYVKFGKTFAFVLAVIAKDFVQGKLPLRATSLVYTTILSFVPLLALSFSVLKSFGAHNQLKPFLNSLFEPLGEKGVEVSANILMFVDNIKVGVLGAIGLSFLLFTVVSLVQKIESAFNSIWNVNRVRSHVQRFTGYLSVITVGPILAFSLLGLKAKFTTNPLVAEALGVASVHVGFMPYVIDVISDVAMPVILFTLINKMVPNTRVRWIPAFVAGVVTAFMWKSVASGFGTFMSNSGNYDAIYSSFAIILLVFIWLYLNWLVILVGGSLCFYVQNPEQAKMSFMNAKLTLQDKIYQSLLLIKNIYEHFEKGQKPLKQKDAVKLLDGEIYADEIIDSLCTHEIIARETEGGDGVVLLKSLQTITMADIVAAMTGERSNLASRKDKDIAGFVAKMESDWEAITLDKILKVDKKKASK